MHKFKYSVEGRLIQKDYGLRIEYNRCGHPGSRVIAGLARQDYDSAAMKAEILAGKHDALIIYEVKGVQDAWTINRPRGEGVPTFLSQDDLVFSLPLSVDDMDTRVTFKFTEIPAFNGDGKYEGLFAPMHLRKSNYKKLYDDDASKESNHDKEKFQQRPLGGRRITPKEHAARFGGGSGQAR